MRYIVLKKKIDQDKARKKRKIAKAAKVSVGIAGSVLAGEAARIAFKYVKTNKKYLGRPTRTTGKKIAKKVIKRLILKR